MQMYSIYTCIFRFGDTETPSVSEAGERITNMAAGGKLPARDAASLYSAVDSLWHFVLRIEHRFIQHSVSRLVGSVVTG